MADVLLLSAAPADAKQPHAHDELERMRLAAERDRFGVHRLTDDPGEADVILFVEDGGGLRHYRDVRRHPYVRDFREKCFLFAEPDHAIPFLPGIYASIEKRWHFPQRTRSGPYLRCFTHDFITYDPEPVERSYLYSFLGSAANHPVREEIMRLDHDAQYLLDTSQFWPYGELEPMKKDELEQRYVDVCRRSAFVLCPRGLGPSSHRLFESLRMGRAPVILSDQWVPPAGPDWEAFSLRIPERHAADLPRILAAHEGRAEEMGRLARQTWEDWFSAEATFHRSVNWCLEIMQDRKLPEALLRFTALVQLLRPLHLRAFVRKQFLS